MKKENILAMSREENKKQDPFEQEIVHTANRLGILVAALLAGVFSITEVLMDGDLNLGLYAVVFSISAVNCVVRAIKLHQAKDIVHAITQVAALIFFSVLHMARLLAG